MSKNKKYEIKESVKIESSIKKTFENFVNLEKWWPQEYTWSNEVLESIGFEKHENGLFYEKGPFGFTINWGRVLIWQPPKRLKFTWQISPARQPEPNPDKASEVEINFIEEGKAKTKVELHHVKFSNHGKEEEKYYEALNSEQGWKYILNRFAENFDNK